MTEEMKAMIELVNKSLKEVESMSKADKMFEVEGYIKKEDINCIIYEVGTCQIVFDKNNETVKPRYMENREYPLDIDDKDILAIYTKTKEMGWLNEQSI